MTNRLANLLAALAVLVTGCAVDVDPAVAPATPDGAAQPAPAPAEPVTATLIDVPPAPPPLPPIRVYVEPGIDNRDEVIAGVNAWAEATRGVREWTFTDDDLNSELAIIAIGPYGNTCATGGTTHALGCVQGTGGLWHNVSGAPMYAFLISTTWDDTGHARDGYQQNAKLVTMHEIGHLLGLRHDVGIMAPTFDTTAPAVEWECPDASTIDTLESKLQITGLRACAEPSTESK